VPYSIRRLEGLRDIDLNDTRAVGYQWYIHNTWPGNTCWNSVLAASDFSIVGGNLFYAGDAHNQGDCFGVQTAAYRTGSKYVGKTFTPGFYVDVYASYIGTTPNGTNGWPTFWAWPVEDMLGVLPTGTYFTEIDFFEALSTGIGSPPNTQGSEHEWKEPQLPSGYQVSNTNSAISVTQDSTLHHYGILVGAMADNGGTGRLYRYFDNNPLTSNQCTYSRSALPSCPTDGAHAGSFSEIDSMHYNIILGAGTNWGATFHEVTVYCNPSAESCHR
jgi:hypothetical protein